MSDYSGKAFRGFLIVFSFNIAAAFLGYLIRVFLARELTPTEYGLFYAVMTFVLLFTFFKDLGLSEAYARFIPDYLAKKKDFMIRLLIRFVMLFTVGFAFVIIVILWLLSDWLAANYFHHDAAAMTLIIFLIAIFVAIPRLTYRGVFQAYQRHLLFAGQYLVENSLLLLLLFLFLSFQATASTVALLHLVTYGVIGLLFFSPFLRLTKIFSATQRGALPYKRLFKFGFFIMLGSLGSIIILYTDTLILTYFRPLAEVGIYNAVVPTVMLLAFFGVSIAQVFYPLASELWAKRALSKLREGTSFVLLHSVILLVPVVILFGVFPERVLLLLFGESYLSGAPALAILSFAVFFITIYTIIASILSGLGKPEISTKALLLGSLLNLILNCLFIPNYGMIGAAISSLLSYAFSMILITVGLHRLVKLNIPVGNLFKTLLGGVLFLSLLLIIRSFALGSLAKVGVAVFGAGIIYMLFLMSVRAFNIKGLLDMIRRSL